MSKTDAAGRNPAAKSAKLRSDRLLDATPELRRHHDVVRDAPTDRPGVTALRVTSQRTIDRQRDMRAAIERLEAAAQSSDPDRPSAPKRP